MVMGDFIDPGGAELFPPSQRGFLSSKSILT